MKNSSRLTLFVLLALVIAAAAGLYLTRSSPADRYPAFRPKNGR
jgi:hypothetical protein